MDATTEQLIQQNFATLAERLAKAERRIQQLETQDGGFLTGTYTPTYEGGTTPGVTTYSFQGGTYAIVGNIILVTGQINWTGATGTGEARISLPYTANTGNWTGSLRLTGVTFANSTPQILHTAGNLYFVMDSPITNGNSARVQVEAVGSVIWTIAYTI